MRKLREIINERSIDGFNDPENTGEPKGLVNIHEKYLQSGKHGDAWIFRGVSSSEYDLETTLERALKEFDIDQHEAPDIEKGLLRRFQRQAPLFLKHLPKEGNYLEWFSLMQHYGCPTRLLDFTYSFFVATFFAIEKMKIENTKDETSAVWAINATECGRKARLLFDEANRDILNDDPHVQNPNTFTKVFMSRHSLVSAINPYTYNKRMVMQQGIFLCPGDVGIPLEENIIRLFDSNEEAIRENVCRYLIGKQLKYEFLEHLHCMNMNRATLFPGLEGFAQSLKGFLFNPKKMLLTKKVT